LIGSTSLTDFTRIMAQFQLFPPPPPKLITTIDPNPFRRAKSKPIAQGESFPLETLIKSPGAESVIIQIIEEPRKIQPLPRAHIAPPRDQIRGVDRDQQGGNDTPANAGTLARSSPPPPPPAASVSVCSASPTLVRGSSTPSQSPANSPIVPMRSMFPTYNPSLPLNQQPYYPQRRTSLQGQSASRQEYSPRLASPSQLDEVLGGAKTAPSSILDFPMDDVAIPKPQFSSAQELDRLWEATNGQEPDAVLPGFDLQMSRYGFSYHAA
jgi:hypothetical protein